LGVEILTEHDGFVHVSGHPGRKELMRMYQWLRPQTLVPVHGELRHLQEQASLARECQIPHSAIAENGTMLKLSKGRPVPVNHVETGRLAVDGKRLVPIGGTVIRERNRLRMNGSAVATVVVNDAGNIVSDPQLTVQGLLSDDDDENWEFAVDAIIDAVNGLPPDKARDDDHVAESARIAVRRSLRATIGKRPVTDIHVVRV
jgi:ribonuclease J